MLAVVRHSVPMAMRTGSTAAESATSRTASKEAAMTDKEFKSEAAFQIAVQTAKEALLQGLITEEEYRVFVTKMMEKYRPTFGVLFS